VPVDSQYYQVEQANAGIGTQQPQPEQPDAEAEQLNRELWELRNEQGQWRKGVAEGRGGQPGGASARVAEPRDVDGRGIARCRRGNPDT
jgi:hypothetical protein